jgi:hypothetical protein
VAVREAQIRERLEQLRDQLDPRLAHQAAVLELDSIFRSGRFPEPAPEGFLPGHVITTSVATAVDNVGRWLSNAWMPWLGKAFDSQNNTGVNVLTVSARTPMKAVWPSYEPLRESAQGIEAFPFRTRRAPGELDADVDVLKIDYDFDENPNFVIRRVLDELVEVDSGFYLGKILYRWKGSFRRIGFFTLERP